MTTPVSAVPTQAMSATEVARLSAPDFESFSEFPSSKFGESISLDGDSVLIGDSDDSEAGESAGAAYIYTRTDGVWRLEQKILAPDATEDDNFGESVALEGDTALIGAIRDDELAFRSGSAYVYARTNGVWTLQQKLLAADGKTDDVFGNSVALDGDTAIAGAPKGNVEGTVYIYDLSAIGTVADDDEDGVPNTEDNCPAQFNPLQEDFDRDRSGDACDTDDDNDNVLDDDDNCPLIINADQANFDNDSAGDICDEDDDDDGVPDLLDVNPFDPNVGTGIEVTLSRSILSSQDDVELRGNGRVAVDSNDLELGLDEGFEGINTVVFLRFADLAIPQGAIIRDAQVLFWVDEPTEEFSTLILQGLIEADGRPSRNGVPFGPQTYTIVDWLPPPWTTRGTAPVEQTQTPDLSAIVQEVVNGSGWQGGNALVLLIGDTLPNPNRDGVGIGQRVAESFDGERNSAPLLHVEYE
ncbi:MAG: FG-GAP repeat protein [Granulosicoccus sp.]